MQKRKLFAILIFFLIYCLTIQAQEFDASLIPDSLKENAHAVVRQHDIQLRLSSENSGTEHYYKVITVLDKNGEEEALLMLYYDKDSRISIAKARLYNAKGKLIKKIKDSEIIDYPISGSGTMYSDNRIMYYKPDFAEYPYTLEYEYDETYSNLISYEDIIPLSSYNLSVQKSSFSISYPNSISYNKKECNIKQSSTQTKTSNRTIDKWEFEGLKAIDNEYYDSDFSERIPQVHLMPKKIVYNEYSGIANTWNEYGAWINKLYEGRDQLAELEKPRVDAILSKAKTRRDSIKCLYEYMQKRTRYIGIQLGIGGFQPFSAQSVFENGYGDCKALSNYMHSLLKYAGIASYPTLNCAGKNPKSVMKDFPNFSTFNHVILCVPNASDTIWLECTSQIMPFGYLGTFTDNRDVLLLTPEGGKWARTKHYSAKDNCTSTNATFKVDSLGNATASITKNYKGIEYDLLDEFFYSNADLQKKWLYSHSTIPSLQIDSYSIDNTKTEIPVGRIAMAITSRNYSSFSGKYMFLPLNMLTTQTAIPKQIKKRISNFEIRHSEIEADTIRYLIPACYKIDPTLLTKTISSDFGEYTYSIKYDANTIIYCRRLEIKEGKHNAEAYKKFYDFMLAVSKADNTKLMLSKN